MVYNIQMDLRLRSPPNVSPNPPRPRYGFAAAGLHWLVGGLIAVQLGLGWWMNHAVPDHSLLQRQVEAVHISLGLTLLLLMVLRVVVRLRRPAPPLPAAISAWESFLAHLSHLFAYLMILGLALTGWAAVSVRKAPIQFWGASWPRFPGLVPPLPGQPHALGHLLTQAHAVWLVWLFVANLMLHLAGVLKHQLEGNPLLWRMWPSLRP